MTARTYIELFEPPIPRLSLAEAPGGWIVWDQHCRYYVLAPSSLQFCLRFMAAMERKGDAVIDQASVERATWHSVKVGALSEREPRVGGRVEAQRLPSAMARIGESRAAAFPSASLSPRSESASNVVPLREGIA